MIRLFDFLLQTLPDKPADPSNQVWTDREQILCRTKDQASFLAELMKTTDQEEYIVNYYNPEEDKKNHDTNNFTGWYYIYMP